MLSITNHSARNAVYNNILLSLNPQYGSINVSKDSRLRFKSDHNVVSNAMAITSKSSVLMPLTTWSAATGQDTHSIVAKPNQVFVSVAQHNFHLSSRSPAIGRGVKSRFMPKTDLAGNPQPGKRGVQRRRLLGLVGAAPNTGRVGFRVVFFSFSIEHRGLPMHKVSSRCLLEALESRTLLSTYYVSPHGSDAGAGTSAHPWLTLQHAADRVKPGDVVQVAAGQYAGFSLGWNTPQGGTAKHRITFLANRGATIVSKNPNTPDGIDLEGASFVTIQGFTVRNSSQTITRAGIRSVQNQGVILSKNIVQGAGVWGVFSAFSNKIQVVGNSISGSVGQHGVYISNTTSNPLVSNNRIFNNAGSGIMLNGDVSQGGTGIITGAIIQNNIIYGNCATGGAGINGDGLQRSLIQNNLIYNNQSTGIALFQQDAAAPSVGNRIINNTIASMTDSHWAVVIRDGQHGQPGEEQHPVHLRRSREASTPRRIRWPA